MAPLQGNTTRMIHKDALENSADVRAVAFATYHCGIPSITEANYEQLWSRYVALNLAFGTPPGEMYLSKETLHRFVGYGTNSSAKTVSQFNRYLLMILEDRTQKALVSLRNKARDEVKA
jgi:hypothetical protein